jgi:hypothetical protein
LSLLTSFRFILLLVALFHYFLFHSALHCPFLLHSASFCFLLLFLSSVHLFFFIHSTLLNYTASCNFSLTFQHKRRVQLKISPKFTTTTTTTTITTSTGLGTKLARTFVSRCVVGDAGMTYKYLGLRMFGHPWNAGELGSSASTVAVGTANRAMIGHTTKLLTDRRSNATSRSSSSSKDSGSTSYGSCQYNLTLINRCFPELTPKEKQTATATATASANTNNFNVKLKQEPLFGAEKCTVSWHADSSLEHYRLGLGLRHLKFDACDVNVL